MSAPSEFPKKIQAKLSEKIMAPMTPLHPKDRAATLDAMQCWLQLNI